MGKFPGVASFHKERSWNMFFLSFCVLLTHRSSKEPETLEPLRIDLRKTSAFSQLGILFLLAPAAISSVQPENNNFLHFLRKNKKMMMIFIHICFPVSCT